MQKVIHVNYAGVKSTSYSDRLKTINSHLEEGWIVVSTQAVRQEVSCDNGCLASGEYGVTFILQKD